MPPIALEIIGENAGFFAGRELHGNLIICKIRLQKCSSKFLVTTTLLGI